MSRVQQINLRAAEEPTPRSRSRPTRPSATRDIQADIMTIIVEGLEGEHEVG